MTHPSKIVLRKKHFSDWKFVKLFFIAHFFFSFPRDSVVWGPTAWPENQLLTAAPRAKSFNSSCRRQFLLRRISNRSNTEQRAKDLLPILLIVEATAVVTKSTSSGKAARASFSRRRRAFVESSQRSFVAEGKVAVIITIRLIWLVKNISVRKSAKASSSSFELSS